MSFFPTNLIVIGFEANFEKFRFSSWVSLGVIYVGRKNMEC